MSSLWSTCSLTKHFKSFFTESFLHDFKACTSICAEIACLGAFVGLPQSGGTQGSVCCYLTLHTGNLQTSHNRLWFIFLLLNFTFLSQTPEKNILNHKANWFPLRHPGWNWKLNSLLTSTWAVLTWFCSSHFDYTLLSILASFLHFYRVHLGLSLLIFLGIACLMPFLTASSTFALSNAQMNKLETAFYWGKPVLWESW